MEFRVPTETSFMVETSREVSEGRFHTKVFSVIQGLPDGLNHWEGFRHEIRR
jgi:hypothetical protein